MTEDDQVLSRLAAKAIGLEIGEFQELLSSMPDDYIDGGFMVGEKHPAFGFRGYYWHPLEHDGDALRLAVKLGMRVYVYPGAGDNLTVVANDELRAKDAPHISEPHGNDALAATRRAIVRAAAEIGKQIGQSS